MENWQDGRFTDFETVTSLSLTRVADDTDAASVQQVGESTSTLFDELFNGASEVKGLAGKLDDMADKCVSKARRDHRDTHISAKSTYNLDFIKAIGQGVLK